MYMRICKDGQRHQPKGQPLINPNPPPSLPATPSPPNDCHVSHWAPQAKLFLKTTDTFC